MRKLFVCDSYPKIHRFQKGYRLLGGHVTNEKDWISFKRYHRWKKLQKYFEEGNRCHVIYERKKTRTQCQVFTSVSPPSHFLAYTTHRHSTTYIEWSTGGLRFGHKAPCALFPSYFSCTCGLLIKSKKDSWAADDVKEIQARTVSRSSIEYVKIEATENQIMRIAL